MKAIPLSIKALRGAILLFVCLDLLLLGLGLAIHPAAFIPGFFFPVGMQAIYACCAWISLKGPRGEDEARVGLLFGLLIAVVFVAEIILELIVTVADNTPFAYLEYGSVFLLLWLAGLSAAWRSGSTRTALSAAVWSAMLGSLLWYAALLATYYLFRDTPQQNHVFLAEGTFDDFRSSGMTDFEAFVLQDFWGAGFFHLLLALPLALILGAVGLLFGRLARRLRRQGLAILA